MLVVVSVAPAMGAAGGVVSRDAGSHCWAVLGWKEEVKGCWYLTGEAEN